MASNPLLGIFFPWNSKSLVYPPANKPNFMKHNATDLKQLLHLFFWVNLTTVPSIEWQNIADRI